VPLRDIAAAADVHLALIRLYVGTREEFVLAVFDFLSDQVAQAVADDPLSGQGFEPDTVAGGLCAPRGGSYGTVCQW